MLTTLKTLWRRLDFWLRDEDYYPTTEYRTYSWDDMKEEWRNEDKDPLRTRVYWAVRRFWNNHWLCNPRKVWFDVVCAKQRVTRGWDDRVPWSVDWWMNGIMPDILKKLKKDKHGIPMSVFPTGSEYTDEHGNPNEAAHEIASKLWDEILDKIIAGFEANQRMKDHLYEEELGPYPMYRPDGVSRDAWKKIEDDHFRKSQELAKRDEAIFNEGIKLFGEYYNDLWD